MGHSLISVSVLFGNFRRKSGVWNSEVISSDVNPLKAMAFIKR
jgi:hypothetical protein